MFISSCNIVISTVAVKDNIYIKRNVEFFYTGCVILPRSQWILTGVVKFKHT